MKESSGKKIVGFSFVVLVIGVCAAILIALFSGIIANSGSGNGRILLIGLIAAAIILITCWISSIIIAGFGELVEDVRAIKVLMMKEKNK